MQTHDDSDFLERAKFLSRLQDRAHSMVNSKASQITAGKPGEAVFMEWQRDHVHVRQLPDDEQGILRISIGGGETPVPCNYLVFRGKHNKCVDLLRQALRVLERGPD